MQPPHDLYLNGRWLPASDGARLPIVDPATEETVDSVPVATSVDLDAALDAAAVGWKAWREVDAWTRSAALRRAAELIRERSQETAAVLTEEQGKPLAESRGELAAAADDGALDSPLELVPNAAREHLVTLLRVLEHQLLEVERVADPDRGPASTGDRHVT